MHFGRVTALTVVVASLMLATLYDIQYSAAALAVPFLATIYWMLGITHLLPSDRYGLAYCLLAILLPLAPAMGSDGTIVRFALAGAFLVLVVDTRGTTARNMPAYIAVATLSLLALLAISTVTAPSLGYGITRLLNWTMFIPAAFVYFRRPRPGALTFGLLASAGVQYGGVVFQLQGIYGGTWGGLLVSGTTYTHEGGKWITRYTGFVLNPNNLGFLLSAAALVLIIAIIGDQPLRIRLAGLFGVGALVYGMLLTSSRGALLALFVGVLVSSIYLGFRPFMTVVLSGAVTLLGVTSLRWTPLNRVISSYGEIADETDKSYLARVTLWADRLTGIDYFDILAGGGFGATNREALSRQSGLGVDSVVQIAGTVDNAWIKLLLETGALGVAALAALLVGPTLAVIVARSEHRDRRFGATLLGVTTIVVWASTSYDIFDINPWNGLIPVLIGVALSLNQGISRTSTTTVDKDTSRRYYPASRPTAHVGVLP